MNTQKPLLENRRHSSAYIPYSYYKSRIPDYFPYVPMHWHKEFELNYIIEGSAQFRNENISAHAKVGDIFIIQPNAIHSIDSDTAVKYDTIVFSSDMLLGLADDRCSAEMIYPLISGAKKIQFPVDSQNVYYEEIRTVTENIISAAKSGGALMDLLMKSELLKLIWLLYKSGAVKDSREQKQVGDEQIRQALEYMNDNFAENIDIDTLAEKAFMSRSHFMHSFKAIAGMGAIEYLNKLRIRKVCEILQSDKMSIAEAAFSCGFKNLSNFNRQFKKAMGISPKEYKSRQ